MKTLCIIPARSGSKSIKNKNLIRINGMPLIYHSIKTALSVSFLTKVIFSSDSKKYLNYAKKFGLKNLHLRSKKLSTDSALTEDLIFEILKQEKKLGNNYDAILLLQPTSPFRRKRDIEKSMKLLKSKKYDTVISIKETKDHPSRFKIFDKKKKTVKNYLNKKYSFLPRQNLPKVYIRSGSIYYFKINNLFKHKSIMGKKIYGIKVENKYGLNIDSYEDVIVAKFYDKKN